MEISKIRTAFEKEETDNKDDIRSLSSRQLNALETKQALFDSAIKLFAEKGFSKVTINDITAKAGTSKGSFYTYYKSKDHVILEHYKQLDEHYLNISKDMSGLKTASERLFYFTNELYTIVLEKMGLDILKVVYNNGLQYDQEETSFILNESRPLYIILQEIIHEGRNDGEFRNDFSERELVIMVIRCYRGLFYDWCIYNGNFNLVKEGLKFFSFFMEGLKEPYRG